MGATVGGVERPANDEETGCGSCISEAAFLPFASRLGFKNTLLDTTNGSEGGL
jgi:hypothetical protein